MKVLVALDSFKGSISSKEANEAVKKALDDHDVICKAIGDGGENTMEAIADSLNGNIEQVEVCGPLNNKIIASYAICNDLAVIEMAKCAGITLLSKNQLDPLYTTTYGVGQMILDAMDKGCRNFIICIGGSCTNDGGIGMLSALGYEFLGHDHKLVSLNALGLKDLAYIIDNHDNRLDSCHFEVACDVDNPLCGINGASYVFARQKGASEKDIENMDKWLKHYADICGYDDSYPGCGAAGGLGFALKYFLNAKLEKGIEIVIEKLNIENIIQTCDVVICGEGKMDKQTLSGKAPYGIARIAKKYHKKVIGIAGVIEHHKMMDDYFDKYYQIIDEADDIDDAINNASKYLTLIGRKIKESVKV